MQSFLELSHDSYPLIALHDDPKNGCVETNSLPNILYFTFVLHNWLSLNNSTFRCVRLADDNPCFQSIVPFKFTLSLICTSFTSCKRNKQRTAVLSFIMFTILPAITTVEPCNLLLQTVILVRQSLPKVHKFYTENGHLSLSQLKQSHTKLTSLI